jgi:hypothetical protein
MPKKQTNGEPTLDTLLDMASDLGKSAGELSQSLTAHADAASRVDHGDVSRGPATIEPIDHTMRSKLSVLITALSDFRMAIRHSQLIGEHNELEKTKITMGLKGC